MSLCDDRNDITFANKDIYFKGERLGILTKGGLTVTLNETTRQVDNVAGFEGIFKQWNVGTSCEISAEVFTPNLATILSKMLDGKIDTNAYGGYLGSGVIRDDTSFTGEVVMHDSDIALTTRTNDIKLFNVALNVDLAMVFGGDTPDTITITFTVMPDCARETGKNVGFVGDWSKSVSTPQGVLIQASRICKVPYLSQEVTTFSNDQVDRYFAHRFDLTDSGITLAVNEVAGYTAADVAITFDTLTSASAIEVGDIISAGTGGTLEHMYVQSIAYDSGNITGTVTVTRESISHNAQALIEDQELQLIKAADVIIQRIRDSATWASSDDTKVDVGNTYGSATINELPGTIVHVATGVGNITATHGSVSSPAFAVTAS